MLGSELRRLYLDYFESKGAKKLPSDSLVPQDPTLLFTSAGMVQFKPYFLGELAPPASRATTAQKCLRTTDIEDVGDTSHCTFFEMLGNFSFGDYFKADAIAWAWEFLFDVLKLKLEHVRVTVHEADDEAYGLWVAAGMPERKIFRFDEHSNYWPAGRDLSRPERPVRSLLRDLLRHAAAPAARRPTACGTISAGSRSGTWCSCSTSAATAAR